MLVVNKVGLRKNYLICQKANSEFRTHDRSFVLTKELKRHGNDITMAGHSKMKNLLVTIFYIHENLQDKSVFC